MKTLLSITVSLMLTSGVFAQGLPVEDLPWRPVFSNDIQDKSFETFLSTLRYDLRRGDSTAILSHFTEFPYWSKYNCCAELPPDGKCPAHNIIFCYGDYKQFGELMLGEMTRGIGPLERADWWRAPQSEAEIYATHHFDDPVLENKFFDYNLIVVLSPFAQVYSQQSENSDILGYAPQHFEISLDPGLYEWVDGEVCWCPVELNGQTGYIKCDHVLTGFDYVRFFFAKIDGVWKVSGVVQPPGC